MLAQMKYLCMLTAGYTLFSLVLTTTLNAHGDVTPQAVDVSGLPKLGENWREENPWRDPNGPYWKRAIEVGASGYNQNCARCHGLGGVSGGLAPDLRYLEANVDGDEWYVERYRMGYTQNGVTKMPAFDELLGQEAAWAIRTYIETRADEDALAEHLNTLNGLRDELRTALEAGSTPAEAKVVSEEIRSKLETIAAKIMTASGAPIADSVASEAARLLDGSHPGLKAAAESLTIGLSAAK